MFPLRRPLPFLLTAGLLLQTTAALAAQPAAVAVSLPQALQVAAAPAPVAPQAAPAVVDPAPQVTLRRAASITGDTVRLGDLFQAVQGQPLPQADAVVMAAPMVGSPILLDGKRLTAIAARHGLNWAPTHPADSVTLSRETATIGSEEILAVLRQDLQARGMPATAEVDLATALQPVAIAAGQLGAITVTDATYDPRSARFTAVVETSSGSGDARRLRLSGRAVDTVEVPVLARQLNRKDVIQPTDIQWVRLRSTDLRDGTITDPDKLVGLSARRPLRAGELVLTQDLERALVVTKGQPVVMELHTPLMSLTAQGVALEPGAVGDVIRLQNPQSQKTVTGVIIGPRQVRVTVLGQVAALPR